MRRFVTLVVVAVVVASCAQTVNLEQEMAALWPSMPTGRRPRSDIETFSVVPGAGWDHCAWPARRR